MVFMQESDIEIRDQILLNVRASNKDQITDFCLKDLSSNVLTIPSKTFTFINVNYSPTLKREANSD